MPSADAKPLTADEITKLKHWIAEGAKWADHWSLNPLAKLRPVSAVFLKRGPSHGV